MTNKSPYAQIEKLVEAGKKASIDWTLAPLNGTYYGTKVTVGESLVSFWGNKKGTPSERELQNWSDLEDPATLSDIMCDGHYEDVGDLNDALFVIESANSRQAIEDMLNEHKRIEKIKSQVDVEALREALNRVKEEHYVIEVGSVCFEDVTVGDSFNIYEAAQTLLTLLEGEG